jgi:hypothetical protein
MNDALYNCHVNEVARLLVEPNEDACVYEQHIAGRVFGVVRDGARRVRPRMEG